ncbi:MAG TPA: MFS transporter [Candidatus Baltobacteraceae bacterium]
MVASFAELDQAKVNRFHVLVTFLSGMGVFLEGYDFTNIGAALVFLIPYYHLTPLTTSWLAISTYLGTVVGALGAGYLADRFGRRHLYMWDVVAYAFFGLLSAVSFSYPMLFLARVGLGAGIGADQALSFTIIGEFAPRKSRGKLNGSTMILWGVGAFASFLISYLLLPIAGPNTWRIVFAFSAIPALLVLIGRRALPETPRWLLQHGLTSQAKEAMDHTLSGATNEAPLDTRVIGPTPKVQLPAFKDLFSNPVQAKRTLYIVAMWGLVTVSTYGISFFTPIVFKHLGYTDQRALLGGVFVGLCATVGAFLMTVTVDKWGRKTLAAGGFLVMAAIIATVGTIGKEIAFPLLLTLFCLFQFAAFWGPGAVVVVTAPEMFPTRLRSLGVGLGSAAGRVGAIAGILMLPTLLASFGLSITVYVFAAVSTVAFILMLLLGTESKDTSLEGFTEIAPIEQAAYV